MRILLCFLVSCNLLFSCSNEKGALSVVPLDADGIAVIDFKSIGGDLFSGETSFEEIQELLTGIQLGTQNEFKAFMKIVPKLPISVFSKGAVFTYSKENQRILGISIPLMSEAISSINDLAQYAILKKNGHSYILFDIDKINKGIVLLENGYLLFLKSKMGSQQLVKEALVLNQLKKEASIESKDLPNHDCYLFAQSNGIEISGGLDFEKGEITIKLDAKFEEQNPLDTIFNTPTKYNFDTSSIVVIQSNINPHLLNKIPLLPKVIKNVIDTSHVFYGPISLTLQGVELRSRHFISYEEDEEFNLVEKTVVKIDTVNKIHGYIEGNTIHFDSFLNYFLSLNVLKKEKHNWYSSPVLLDSYQIFSEDDKVHFASYEHDFNDFSHTTKGLAHIYINIEKIHDLENNSSFWEGYTLEIDPEKHFYVDKRLKSVDLLIPDNSSIKLEIKFKNRNGNGFIESIRILKEISDLKKRKINS